MKFILGKDTVLPAFTLFIATTNIGFLSDM
jgi:hypothetical protein